MTIPGDVSPVMGLPQTPVSPPSQPLADAAQRALLAECDTLRERLAKVCADAERLQGELDKTREHLRICKLQEEEYRQYIRRLTGFDPYIDPKDIDEALHNGITMEQIIEEIEREAGLTPSCAGHG